MKTCGTARAGAILLILLASWWLSAPAAAWQAPSTAPAAPKDAPTTAPAADKDPLQGEGITQDDIDKLLERLTPEQIENLVKAAMVARLNVERQQVVAEIREGLLYDPQDIDEAVKIVTDRPADTQNDNIDRICRAFAKADVRFAKPYDLFKAGKFKEAAEAAKQILDVQQATYLSAARCFIYAEALAKSGNAEDAVEAYRDILVNMPDRISFAASAALSAAEMYEKMNRFLYALEMYTYCVKNYALTIDKAKADEILKKVEAYAETYKDPLGSVTKKMQEVQARLSEIDSGKETQKKEQEIVALLDDLIKTAEEKQQQGGGQGQQRQRGERQGEQQGQSQSQGQAQGQAPSNPQQPTSPMKDSMLVPGAVQRPTKLSKIHASNESGDWAQMPPRQREKLQENLRKTMSERYRDIIKDYHTRLSQQGPE